jgi:hypothetical protein
LGFELGSRSRPFSPVVIQVAEIVVAIAEFVVGFLLLAFYALDVSGAGGQSAAITTVFPTLLLPIAFLSFTFGIFSLVIAMLALTNQPSERRVYPERNYVSPDIAQTSVAVGPADKQTTPQEYAATAPQVVAELSRTVLQRTSSWSERVCAECGREVQENAKFCDSCGSRLQPSEQAGNETPIQHPRTS